MATPASSRFTQQPQGVPLIDRGNPLMNRVSEVVLPMHKQTLVRNFGTSTVGTVTAVTNRVGRAVAFPGAGSDSLRIAGSGDSVFTSNSDCTVFVYRRSLDTTNRASNLFGYDKGSGERVQAHAPYSDGNIYWDFADATNGSGRISTPFTKSTEPETLVFIAGGGRGREIWRNGVRIANNASATANRISDTFTSVYIGYAGSAGPTSDNEEVYLFGVVGRAWTDTEIVSWSKNPWQVFLQRSPMQRAVSRSAIVLGGGGGGGTARPSIFVCT